MKVSEKSPLYLLFTALRQCVLAHYSIVILAVTCPRQREDLHYDQEGKFYRLILASDILRLSLSYARLL